MGRLQRFAPIQSAGEERLQRLRVRNPLAHLCVDKGGKRLELLPSPFGDLPSQFRIEVGEEEERRSGCPLLAHEEKRRLRRNQQQRAEGPEGGKVDLMIQPGAIRTISDLIVVLN